MKGGNSYGNQRTKTGWRDGLAGKVIATELHELQLQIWIHSTHVKSKAQQHTLAFIIQTVRDDWRQAATGQQVHPTDKFVLISKNVDTLNVDYGLHT